MSGVEVLAGLGLMASGLFRYNRENYEFDQEQRFEREELRLKMQVERFSLFREDVRDLVELTVNKMDLYHMIGALFLKACIVYYCEGFFTSATPVYLLALYYLSNACSVVYLILGVWLAMHASISSHGSGTRLLTRFLRLPIPGNAEINTLNARYADFEKQTLDQVMRLPFLSRKDGKAKHNDWKQRAELEGSPSRNMDFLGVSHEVTHDHDEEMLQAVEMKTQRHVNLFRKFQAQWQCYDAYTRVCMSLGVRQLVQSITYYLLGHTLVENKNYTTALMLVIALQAVGVSITVVDIYSWPCWANMDISVLGWAPSMCAWLSLVIDQNCYEDSNLRGVAIALSVLTYPLEVIWFELLLRAATPTDDIAALPRHFRSVLFMDVFSEVEDPTEVDVATGSRKLSPEEREAAESQLPEATGALALAQAALRRWQTLPPNMLLQEQLHRRTHIRRRLRAKVQELQEDLRRYHLPLLTPDEERIKAWEELSSVDREEDPFINSLLGPIHTESNMKCFLDLEKGEYTFDPQQRHILTIEFVMGKVRDFEMELDLVREAAGDRKGLPRRCEFMESEDEETTPLARRRKSMRWTSREHSIREGHEAAEARRGSVRLPWLLVQSLTRCAQAVWVAVFLAELLQLLNHVPRFDTVENNIYEERRLADAPKHATWQLKHLEMHWPMGQLFRPEALSCLPSPAAELAERGRLLVRSPFALYRSLPGSDWAVLQEVMSSSFLPGTTALCGPDTWPGNVLADPLQGCLLAAPVLDGLVVWPAQGDVQGSEAATLRLQGTPWQVLAGAAVPCNDVGGLGGTRSGTSPAATSWCLMLIGWAGRGVLSMLVVPLRSGPGSMPLEAPGRPLRHHYELPLAHGHGAPEAPSLLEPSDVAVAALHMEPTEGRLWMLTAGGELQAWAVLHGPPRYLGRWPVPQPAHHSDFQPVALCEAPHDQGLFLAGRVENHFCGTESGPALFQAALPPGL